MDWKLILRIAVIITLMLLLANSVAGCRSEAGPIIDWNDCSQQIGDHPCDFTLMDQDGKDFNLYDHYGKIIILDFSAMWCGPCALAALEVEEIQKKYGDKVIYVTILIENLNQNSPSKSDLKKWAKSFGIESAPVLSGSRSLLSSDPNLGWPLSAWPQFHIIDQNMMLIESFKGFYSGRMEEVIKNNLDSDTGVP
jgi:thiol-disulfide isomerase/thioredoxin